MEENIASILSVVVDMQSQMTSFYAFSSVLLGLFLGALLVLFLFMVYK